MEQDLNAILQQQLRDIQMPEPVSWWPPAPGWWILLILVIALICFAIWKLMAYLKRNQYRKQAGLELKRIYAQWQEDANAATYLQTTNALLKRVVQVAAADTRSAALNGGDWANLLNSWSKTALSEKAIYALTQAGYQANPQVDIHALQAEIEHWLRVHKQPYTKKSTLPKAAIGAPVDA